MTRACAHPPEKHRTGFYGGAPTPDALWIACGACGSVLRTAPIADRLEAEWSAQAREEA